MVDVLAMAPWSDPGLARDPESMEPSVCTKCLAVEEVEAVEVEAVELREVLGLWAALGAVGIPVVYLDPRMGSAAAGLLALCKRCVTQREKIPSGGQVPQFW